MSNDLIGKISKAGEFLKDGKITQAQYDKIVDHLVKNASTKKPPVESDSILEPNFTNTPTPQISPENISNKKPKTKTKTILALSAIVVWFIYSLSTHAPIEDPKMAREKAISDKKKFDNNKKTVQENRRLATIKSLKRYIQASDFKAALNVYKNEAYNLRSHERKELAALALTMIKPIPAAKIEDNKLGYALLGKLSKQAEHIKKAKEYAKKSLKKALAPLNKNTDKITKTSFYKHKNSPKYVSSRSTAYLYIGERNNSHWLRMQIQYNAEDWLFVKKVTAYFDGTTRPLAAGNFERDNASGDIWEWIDIKPNAAQIETLKKLANAKEAILRFEGRQYRSDKTLSRADKKAILQVLKAFEALKAY